MKPNSALPENAIYASHYFMDNVNAYSSKIYICRGYYERDLTPGMYIPDLKKAFIAFLGYEYQIHDFEVLVGGGLEWVPAINGESPSNAIEGGIDENQDIFYIGRGVYNNTVLPGKVHRLNRCLYVQYKGFERCLKIYEVLVVP